MWFSLRLFLAATRLLPRERRDVVLEKLALRHQLAIYQRSQRRPVLEDRDRRFWSTLARGWSGWRETVSVVQPDTVVRWHRTAWRLWGAISQSDRLEHQSAVPSAYLAHRLSAHFRSSSIDASRRDGERLHKARSGETRLG